MSKQIDEKVVSMQFDNAQFEKNVSTTMSTMDKLKQKLRFKDSAKGLENVSNAAKNVNMSGLSGAVDTVRSKFSAMEVIGVTALANITNSAVNAGKRIVSALTIDPVKTGFQEYETQINAVQTILANTESKGTTIDDVNEALETLNTYADKTIYNFTEMTRNIGTFTAAGVDLDTSVNAIQGIANLAAVSGSTSQQASTAMYQLSQALSSGTVKLMDWNSVVNAGMGGEVFQNALKETARVHGVAIDSMIKEQGSFRETLSEGWLTSEILTETLGKFTMATEGATEAEVEANRAKLKSLGYTDEQIEGIFKLGNTATNAATKVKTFTQLWDVMKESAQSGWSKTWKLIIGDFEGAKNLLTPLADFFTGMINKMSDWRNNLLEGALGKSFKGLSKTLSTITKPMKKASDAVKNVKDTLGDLNKIVDEVIIGKWKNGEDRFNALTEAGHNYYAIQNKVNEKLGDSFRYTDKQIEAQDVLLKKQVKSTESKSDETKATTELTEAEIKRIAAMAELSDAELKAKGYTDEQIKAFRELKSISEKLGIPIKDLITNLDEINGRWLLINGFKNIGKGLIKVFKAVKDAWSEIFPPASSEGLFNIIAGFHKLTSKMIMSDEKADKLKRTFKGIFALLKLTFTLISGPIKIAFKILSAILGYFNLDLLTVTAYIGDAIVAFSNWVGRVVDFKRIVDKVLPSILEFGKGIKDWIVGIKDAENIPKYIFEGLINGLKSAFSGIWNVLGGLVTGIIDYVKNLLGIHSPSTVFIAIGGFIIAGLVMGLTGSFPDVLDFFKGIGDKISGVLSNIDWGKVFSVLISLGLVAGLLKVANALDKIASPFEAFGDVLTSFSKGVKAFSMAMKAEAIKSIAISILILVGSIAILTMLDTGKMFIAIGAIVILLGAIAGLLFMIDKMTGKGDKASLGKDTRILQLAGLLLSLATTMLILAWVAKIAAGMDNDALIRAGIGLAALAVIITGLIFATRLVGKFNIQNIGGMILGIATAMLMMALVAKIVAGMDNDAMIRAGIGLAALAVIITGLIFATKLAGNNYLKGIGGVILGVATAMLMMVIVAKIVAGMDNDAMIRAGIGLAALAVIITGLIFATRLAGGEKEMQNVAKTIFAISAAIGILAVVMMLLSLMNWPAIGKGLAAVGALSTMMAVLIGVTKNAKDCEKTIFALAVVIAILAGAVAALSFIDPVSLAASVIALSAVMAMLMLVIKSTNKSGDALKSLLGISAAIAVMGGVLYLLGTLPAGSALSSAIALSLLMGVLAGVMVVISKIKKIPASSIGALALMGLVVAELAAILAIMALLDINPSIETAKALSLLLVTMSASLVALSVVGLIGSAAFVGIGALAALIGALGGIMIGLGALMNYVPQLEDFLDKGIVVLEKIGYALGSFFGNIVGGLLAGITSGLPEIGDNLSDFMKNATPFIEGAKQINKSTMQGVKNLAEVILILTKASLLEKITSWFTGGNAMADFAEQLIPFGEAMVEFSRIVSGNIDEEAVNAAANAGKMMAEMADTIPNSGGVVGWFMGENDIDDFGEKLVSFGKSITAFSKEVAGNIDPEAVQAAATAGKMMTEMADTIPNSGGIVSWFTGNNDIDDFGEKLVPFGKSIAAFSKEVAGKVDPEAITAAANAGKMLTEMADTVPNSGGVVSWFTGRNDLDSFGNKLKPFGTAMADFSAAVSGKIDPEATTAAANAGKMLAEIQEALPNVGGIKSWFDGNTMDMDVLSSKLKPFGTAMAEFSTEVSGKIDAGAATAAANAGKILADMNAALPNVGGINEWFTGSTMSMSTFATNIKDFGSAIVEFSNVISGNIDEEAVQAAANAGEMLSEMNANLPTEGGINSWFTGDQISLEDFGNNIKAFGIAIKEFSDEVSGIEEPKKLTDLSTTICNLIDDYIEVCQKIDGGYYNEEYWSLDIAEMLSSYAKGLKTLDTALDGIDIKNTEIEMTTITTMIGKYMDLYDNHNKIVEINKAINGIATVIYTLSKAPKIDNIENITNRVTEYSKLNIDAILAVYENAEDDVKTAAVDLMTKFGEGIKSKTDNSKTKCTDLVNACLSAINKKYEDFKSAGKYLMDGFKSGINAKKDAIYKAVESVMSGAEETARVTLQINSPSKVFRAIGMSVPEGFAMGIDKLSGMVKNSSVSMANSAVDRVRNSISHIADMINSDIDSQPTIRPVLDLSEVRAGTGALNNMLGMGSSFGIRANVGSISSMMNDRIQNGSDSDIVSAIEDLGRKLNNMSGDTYTVNGVTYDDGSNINDAVKTIVRAARVARRV